MFHWKFFDPGKAPKGKVTFVLILALALVVAELAVTGLNPNLFPQDSSVFPHSSALFQNELNPGAFPEWVTFVFHTNVFPLLVWVTMSFNLSSVYAL